MPDKDKGQKKHFSLWDGAALMFFGSKMSPQRSKNFRKALRNEYLPPEHYALYDSMNGPAKDRYEKRRAAEKAAERAAKKEAKHKTRHALVGPASDTTEAGPAPPEEDDVSLASPSVQSHRSHRSQGTTHSRSTAHSKSDKGKGKEKDNGKGKGKGRA